MTEEQRNIIQEEFDKAAVNNNRRMLELDQELIANLEAEGVKINEVNLSEFTKLVVPIYKNIGVSDEFYNKMMKEIEDIRKIKNK